MKNADSQLSYLHSRGKNYTKKYSIYKKIILEFSTGDSILELFGGVGITTYLIRKYFPNKLLLHTVIEIDDDCFSVLAKNFNKRCNLIKTDSDKFKFSNNIYDYIFHDRSFNPSKINELERFKKFKGTIILTDTGIFHLKFDKEKDISKYFNTLNNSINVYGLYINKAFYTNEFSILLLSHTITKIEMIDCNDLVYDMEWKYYLDKFVYGKKVVERVKLF